MHTHAVSPRPEQSLKAGVVSGSSLAHVIVAVSSVGGALLWLMAGTKSGAVASIWLL